MPGSRDRAGLLERAQPPVAGRDAELHALSKLGDGQPTVLLQERKNLAVLRARPSLARAVSRFSGAAMIAIGGVLIGHQFAG